MDELIKEYHGLIPNKLLDDIKKEINRVKVTKAQLKDILERVKKEYEGSQIEAGEAIGIITAESFGEPATQMCVTKDEKVILKIKDRIKILKIGEFVDKTFEKVKTRKANNYEIYNPSEDVLVLGLDQDEKLKWERVLALNRIEAPKKLIKINTKSGRGITSTDHHAFVIRKDNKIVSIAGKDLKNGDRLPVMQNLPEHCASFIKVNNYLDNVEENEEGLLTRYKTRAKSIPNNIILNKNFGYFIGAYLSEGHANDGQVSISNMDDNFISNIKNFVGEIGLDYKEEINSRGFALGRDLKISSSLLAQFIKNTCKSGSFNKIVPEFAYSAKEEFVSGLLRGYFDGDANFTVDRKMIRVSSNSKELIDGVALLLNRFRIFSYKAKDKKNQYWLLIPYKYAPLYLKYIGSDIEHKRKKLIVLNDMAKDFWNNNSQDFNDMISGFGDLFHSTAQKIGMPTRYVNNFTKRQKIGRTALSRYMKKFESLAKEKNVNISDELKIMGRMFNSDVVWDEIVKIEHVDYNHKYVYDLTVPGLETFTTFDGIVTHNTLNVKHFAGVSEMQVTSGLPRLIEIFDASKSIKTPSMEVYLNADYAKDPVKVRKIASQIKENILGDVAFDFSI